MTDTTWASSPYTIHLAIDAETVHRLEADARSAGARVIHLTLAGVRDADDLDTRLAQTFMYPHRARGLDAAIDLISDLEWLGSTAGYLLLIDIGDAPIDVITDVAFILPPIVDRWRSGDEPFVASLRGDTDWAAVLTRLDQMNAELDETGRDPWDQGNTHAVPVIDHRRDGSWVDR